MNETSIRQLCIENMEDSLINAIENCSSIFNANSIISEYLIDGIEPSSSDILFLSNFTLETEL